MVIFAAKIADQGTDWPAWITAVSTAVLAAGILVALYGLWDARKTRHGHLITDLSRRWDEPEMRESITLYSVHEPSGINDLLEKLYHVQGAAPLKREDVDLYSKLELWPGLIDTIGVLYDEGAISADVVYKMWGPEFISAWEAWATAVEKLRDLDRTPVAFRYFEQIAALMRVEDAKCAAADAKKAVRAAKKARKKN